jgi:hypothetical protein
MARPCRRAVVSRRRHGARGVDNVVESAIQQAATVHVVRSKGAEKSPAPFAEPIAAFLHY